MCPRVLIIDDIEANRQALADTLHYVGYETDMAKSGPEGIEMFQKNRYDAVLCDIKMPQMDGLEVLERLQDINSDIPVIMITAHGAIDTAVEAIKKGAYDYLEKPPDLNRLLVTVKNACERKNLIKENKNLKRKISKNYEIIGESESIKKVLQIIDKVAATDARVLIVGENGTGKELVARQLHEKSPRRDKPFVEVNCAAIPSELIESELFGHEKGAFTSAHKARDGKFLLAHEGTIFLDEIGDMSLDAQAKVLRVLEEKKIQPIGSDKLIPIDVRVIAATNKNLKEEIKKGTFREDLYHRISVIIIQMPALRERLEDIPLLADHFIKIIANDYNIAPKTITDEAIQELKKLPWTGNIREFRNVIERLMILGGNVIDASDVVKYASPLI